MKPPFQFFRNAQFNFSTKVALGGIYHQGADVGEVLATVARIKDGDCESWYRAWHDIGERVYASATQSAHNGQALSAAQCYLRAAGHFARAAVTLDGTADASRYLPAWKQSRNCWDQFARLSAQPIEAVLIPYEGTTLPGYFCKADASMAPRPLLVIANGADAPIHAMWLWAGAAALARGYNVLLFDGPGQGAALVRQGMPFRHDWENVIGPVLDFVTQRADVDAARIALYGASQGGHWALRAMAFEPRIAAGIADPAAHTLSVAWEAHLPGRLRALLDAGDEQRFNRALGWGLTFSRVARQTLAMRMRPYLTDSPFKAFTAARLHKLGDLCEQIRCPVLLCEPDGEQFWPDQAQQIYQSLPCEKTLAHFAVEDGADGHCEPMARSQLEQRMFDWLAQVMPPKPDQGGGALASHARGDMPTRCANTRDSADALA
ncbi:MAG: dipeptidyl aminopeptidase [Pseudomonadota bacterium]